MYPQTHHTHKKYLSTSFSSVSLLIPLSMAAETASPLPSNITSIKTLAESPGLTSIPATHAFTPDLHGQVTSVPEGSIPVIDYSLLISGTPGQRSKIVHELGRACQDWGFFMVFLFFPSFYVARKEPLRTEPVDESACRALYFVTTS